MTIEQIELRKILTQMLADNGITRETIRKVVTDIIDEKVEKAVKEAIHNTPASLTIETQIHKGVSRFVSDEIMRVARSEIRDQIKGCFSDITVNVKLTDPEGNFKSERSTTI